MASNRCAFDGKRATKKSSEISVQLRKKLVYLGSCEVHPEILPKMSKWSGFSDRLPVIHPLMGWDNTCISVQKEAIQSERCSKCLPPWKGMSSGGVDWDRVWKVMRQGQRHMGTEEQGWVQKLQAISPAKRQC